MLIVHGKGRDDNAHANIIRSYLARWLVELPEVQAFCAALPHHGRQRRLLRGPAEIGGGKAGKLGAPRQTPAASASTASVPGLLSVARVTPRPASRAWRPAGVYADVQRRLNLPLRVKERHRQRAQPHLELLIVKRVALLVHALSSVRSFATESTVCGYSESS